MTIVGVASRDTVSEMEAFVERNAIGNIDHIADVEGEIWEINGIPAQPAWVFVDGESGESFTQFGELGEGALTEVLEDLAG